METGKVYGEMLGNPIVPPIFCDEILGLRLKVAKS